MKNDKDKNKVGRPKLADTEAKKSAMKFAILSLAIVLFISISGYMTFFGGNTSKLEGSSSSIPKCYIEKNWVKANSAQITYYCDSQSQKIKGVYLYQWKNGNWKKVENYGDNSYGYANFLEYTNLQPNTKYKIETRRSKGNEPSITFTTKGGTAPTKQSPTVKSYARPYAYAYDVKATSFKVKWLAYGTEINKFRVYNGNCETKTKGDKIKFSGENVDVKKYVGSWSFPNSHQLKSVSPNTCYVVEVIFDKGLKNCTTKSCKTQYVFVKTKSTTFTVKYHGLGDSTTGYTGTMNDQSITYGKSTALSANGFKRDGYKFVGWVATYGTKKMAKCGNKACWKESSQIKSNSELYIYKNKQKVSKTIGAGKTVHMYAQWEQVTTTNVATTTSNNSTTVKANTTIANTESSSTSSKFSVVHISGSDGSTDCYQITAPSDATYWKARVYYKHYSTDYYGKNKIKSQDLNITDGTKSGTVCFSKQNDWSSSVYRILVAKTDKKGKNLTSSINTWAPNGFKTTGAAKGWAYTDISKTW